MTFDSFFTGSISKYAKNNLFLHFPFNGNLFHMNNSSFKFKFIVLFCSEDENLQIMYFNLCQDEEGGVWGE